MVTNPNINVLFTLQIEQDSKSSTTGTEDGHVALPCLAPSTLFSGLTVKLNEQVVHQTATHHLEKYVLTRLLSSYSQKHYLQEMQNYYPDTLM